jgi:RNA polymerase sigma-70 factor, ECF subfamily
MNHFDDSRDDATLVALVLGGEREAFTPLAQRYYSSVLRLCVRLLGPSFEAQDVAQEAALQTFLGLSRLHEPARFGAWFHAIAANLARSALRRRHPLSLDALDPQAPPIIRRSHDLPSVEEVATARETHDAIVAALKELSVVNREVVIGFYLAGYSYGELATLLGVPLSTVKSRLFKGRQQLRHTLQSLADTRLLPESRQRKEYAVAASELIAVQVETIREYPLTQRSIVVLSSMQGEHYLPIRLHTNEALVIEYALKGRQTIPTTLAHNTMLQLIAALGGQIERMVIQTLTEQSYYATVTLAQGTQRHQIDLRLSDALVLALRAQTPIYVVPSVFDEAGIALEIGETDKAISDAELPEISAPMSMSDEWPRSFFEHMWLFIAGLLDRNRMPRDLSQLRNIAWDERVPAHEVEWQGQAMQAVRLPAEPAAWLLVQPDVWAQLRQFVDLIQHQELPCQPPPIPAAVDLTPEVQRGIDERLSSALTELEGVGGRMLALMHLSGRLAAWQSRDGYEDTVRMGRAAVKDELLRRHLSSLIDMDDEPVISIPFERNTAMDPAGAAGVNVVWTMESLIHQEWMLVVGFATDQWRDAAQQRVTSVQEELKQLLARSETQP